MNICALIIQSARTSRVLSVLHWLTLCLILILPATIGGGWAESAYAQSADAAFAPNVNGAVLATEIQPDGKVVIAGSFTQVNGQPRSYLARLLPNGVLDASLNVTLNGEVKTIKLLPDGSMLLGGSFNRREASIAIGLPASYRMARWTAPLRPLANRSPISMGRYGRSKFNPTTSS
ncbi:MAG: delta-60 repeat domain-containing protein [Anaerolineales bacterium]|nr:delta-60 repeat domain-containing protein [Anaerolineales bacterium]